MQQKNCGVEKCWRLMLYSMIEVSDGKTNNPGSASSIDKISDNLVLGRIAHPGWKAHEDFLRVFLP